jgi:7-carboxy-7-deazaguanine synthase
MTTDWDALEACLEAAWGKPRCVLKIVVLDDADYSYARMAAARYPMLLVYLQVGNPAPLIGTSTAISDEPDLEDLMHRLRWLAGRVLADDWFAATVLPQLHVLAWGNKRSV